MIEMIASPLRAPQRARSRSQRALTWLSDLIRENMPITRHLQFSLFLDGTGDLVATAPLAPNTNHCQTAFGGSLSMLATLTGWAMTTLLLREHDAPASVVIQQSTLDYHLPVCSHLELRCARPSGQEQDSFFETLKRWGKARLPVRSTMKEGENLAFSFEGAYVALAS